MNIIDHTLKSLLIITLCFSASSSLLAFEGHFLLNFVDTSFSCNDLIHVSVDENCQADISADEIVEGFSGDFADFVLEAFDGSGLPIGLPITKEFVGKSVFLKATHLPSGISCWGNALIEDKWSPSIACSNFDLLCFEDPDDYPLPVATDNCDQPAAVLLLAETINSSNVCEGVIVSRTYVARDSAGNQSLPCTQVFTLQPVAVPDLPSDTAWSCEIYAEHPNVIDPTPLTGQLGTTGSGRPDVANKPNCGYHVVHSDQMIAGCGGTFSIFRTWTVLNWCTNEIVTVDSEGDNNQQLIKIYDHSPPQLELEPFTVNANVSGAACKSQAYLPAANVVENCHAVSQRILTPVGEAIYLNGQNGNNGGLIPAPGLGFGVHLVIYEATDACGNTDTLQVLVTVADMTAPVPVCDEITSVSLGANGEAEVLAGVFDDGSYDNCCLDSFLVRRMATECEPSDTLFGATVHFCCADVGDTVMVVFRALDCFGNANDCMVLVLVEDKLPPSVVACPPPQSIDCGFYVENLDIPLSLGDSTVLDTFGQPIFADNCEVIFQNISVQVNLDQCQQGNILRTWQVTDTGGNGTQTCTQSITVNHTSDWVVSFPPDVVANCGESLPDTGEPVIFFENCELIATTFSDELFTIVPDACFKIVRTWVVINWCVVGDPIAQGIVESPENELFIDLDQDGDQDGRTFQDGLNVANFLPNEPNFGAQADGYIEYQQIIKLNDDVAPVVTCDSITPVCVFDTTCTVSFALPLPQILDCSPETTVSAVGDLGVGLGPFLNVPLGTYLMTYQVADHCGNTGFCQTQVKVEDCKPPTPYCKNGLIVELGPTGEVIVIPPFFDAGSFDNCTDSLKLSFSADVNDSSLVLTCGDLGYITVNIWVTDDAGNQAFCETFVLVDDNDGDCQGGPLVAGAIITPDSLPIAGVQVGLNGGVNQQVTTEIDGVYEFTVEFGGDYSVSPAASTDPLNGVSTFDLVLISKHILGIQPLNSPYKIIAADVNQSNAVTTADLVQLRKLILQINTEFPNGKSWRFIERSYIFPNPENPFSHIFPEVTSLNNVETDQLNLDFVGVKLGDVNNSATPQM